MTPKRLSREQARVLRESIRRRELVALSAITLLEIAVVFGEGRAQGGIRAAEILGEIESNPAFQILPFTLDVAAEVAPLGRVLRDPSDRAIVATARVFKLRLITSDQRIIESGLAPVIA